MSGTEIEMNTGNHDHNRDLQQDARAWADFTGTKYTTAFRQMSSPLAQGYLGERISARRLIAVLDHHPVVGARDGNSLLGEDGYLSDRPWSSDGVSDYVELALIADMLRMFTVVEQGTALEVSSYSLKHTAERYLSPHVSYVSNGQLIWAAAALGLPIGDAEPGNPNLAIGVAEREHDYVVRMVDRGRSRSREHHFRPDGYEYLRGVLAEVAAGNEPAARMIPENTRLHTNPFHDWLVMQSQVGRVDGVDVLAGDYLAGVRESDHGVARSPEDIFAIFEKLGASHRFRMAAVRAAAEWDVVTGVSPLVPRSVRTERIRGNSYEVDGFGAGSGSTERYEYMCPCGDGKVVEEHDNIPGFREHDRWLECDKCRAEWRFVEGRSVRDWALEPILVGVSS